ncbi:MAG: DUF3459 domain-containing protein [Acidobacteria bacterium]|nr:DUF3459 domain-containing protein [Acidobacteriota bacterium]
MRRRWKKPGARLLALLVAVAAAASCLPPAPAPPPAPVPPPPPGTVAPPLPLPDWPDAVLYFVIVDRFADGDPNNNFDVQRGEKGTFHGGDLKGLREHLDDIAALGVNALWITPVVDNIDHPVTGAGFPDWAYHGYWADDFLSLDRHFGTPDDLHGLVEDCHRRGMRVLLDVVYNHAGYDSRYAKDPATRGWLRSESAGTCGQDDVTSCVSGLPDFRTELPEVAKYLLDAQIGWARKSGVDGFRLDTVKHVDHPFWQEHRRRTRAEVRDDFFLLGEVWGGDAEVLDPWFAGDELDAGFDFAFQGNVLAFVQGRGRAVAFDRYLKSRVAKLRPGYLLSHFLSSHDVPTAMYQLGGDRELFRLAAVLQFTSAGIPMVYYGEEVGRRGGDWPENRSDMPWGDRRILPGAGQPRDERLREDYRRLIAIRRAHPALSRGAHESVSSEGDLLVFARTDAASGDAVLVAVNRGAQPATAQVAPLAAWGASPPRDAWNDRDVTAGGASLELSIPARGAAIVVAPRR